MITVTLAAVAALLVALYLYFTRTFHYWQVRGIKYEKPIPLFGNNLWNYLSCQSLSETVSETYWKFPKERVAGYFRGTKPELVIRDPEIAKRILIADFAHFYPRGLNPHKTTIEPLMRNLFFADGDLWRLLRQRMTPAFSSSKLKAMFPLIVERAERLQERVLGAAAAGHPLDARDLMARYTTDIIGACGFGLDSNSLKDEDSAFRKLGAQIFSIGVKETVVGILKDFFPSSFKHLKYTYWFEDEVMRIVKGIQKQRNYEPSNRNDFIDLLLELKQKRTIVGESIEKVKPDGTPEMVSLEFDDELFAAQVFVFFAAGFETSSSATSYTLHQLAYHPEVQERVQADIDRVLAQHNNRLSYEAVKQMTYLECAFKEGMRMFPSLGFLVRECARKYTIPDLDVTIDPGVMVTVPLQAMHNDPQYFDNPKEFRPERFLPENFDVSNKYIYLPFGIGPRACIGERLGLMQSVAGLAAVLSRFTVRPGPTTQRHPRIDPRGDVTQSISGGLPLLFVERNNGVTIF